MPAPRAERNRNQSLTLIFDWHENRSVLCRIAPEAASCIDPEQRASHSKDTGPMRSRTTTELFQYWNAIRGDRDLPRRDEIAPADIRSLLPDLFILQRQADGTIRFRLAGTRVCTLFGCELRDQQFSVLWRETETTEIARITERVMTQCAPMLISANGTTAADDTLELELLLAPLASADGDNDRVLGALSPLSRPSWLHITPITRLNASGLSVLEPGRNIPLDEAHIRSGATSVGIVDGRDRTTGRILQLRVVDGGRRG